MDDIPQHLGEDASGKSVWEELLPEWRETPPLVEEKKRPLDLSMHATNKRPRILSPPTHYNPIPYQRRQKGRETQFVSPGQANVDGDNTVYITKKRGKLHSRKTGSGAVSL